MSMQDLAGGSAWFGAVSLSISCKQSSKTLPVHGEMGILDYDKKREASARTDVNIVLRARFNPCAVHLLGQLLSVLRVNLTPIEQSNINACPPDRRIYLARPENDLRHRQIALGANNDARDLANAAEVNNLVVHDFDHVERVARGNRVDEYVAVYPDGVLRVYRRVFVLCTTPVSGGAAR